MMGSGDAISFNRHAGLVPASTAQLTQRPMDVRHSGCRHKAGMTKWGMSKVDHQRG